MDNAVTQTQAAVGQLWRDADPRRKARFIEIVALDASDAIVDIVQSTSGRQRLAGVARSQAKIRVDRLDDRTNYRLISEPGRWKTHRSRKGFRIDHGNGRWTTIGAE